MANGDSLKNIRVVLCGTSHPGNIGAAARAMKTMGLEALYLVRPRRFPDAEAEGRASRATDVLAHATVCDSLADALHGVGLSVACSARARDIAVPAVSAREAAERIVVASQSQPAALVFGNETYGLTGAEVNQCNLLASIPANPAYSSLNLAAAVQVLCYEVRIAATAAVAPVPARVLATHDEVEGFYAHLERVMVDVGFLDPSHPKKLVPRVRRLFGRAALEQEEVNILRGLLKALGEPRRRG